MSGHRLEAAGLGVTFGDRTVLDDITLVAQEGEPMAVSGPSGSGKTVLLHALAGLRPPTRGSVLFDGAPVDPSDAATRARFGIVLQSQGLASGLTSEENVALPLQSRRLDRAEIAARCREALAAVGLEATSARLVDDLSGGQRQRVGVARALAGRPQILLADEPTAELDPANRARILDLLLEPSASMIVFIASNDPEVCEACRHVIHLRDGRLVRVD
jgi:putative ABC transport system ATP-binding protein